MPNGKPFLFVNSLHIETILQISTKTLRPKLTQAEGFILGVGAKMFTIAGPVIVYGTVASVVYGIIYYFCQFVF